MSVATQESLRIVREETHVVAPTPPQDVDRRVEVFRLARENSVFQLVRLNTEHARPEKPTFLHFTVIVGPKGFSSPENELLGAPYGGPFLRTPPPDWSGQAPIRLHRVLVSDNIELEITSSVLPGELKIPMLFSSPLPMTQSSAPQTQA